MLDRDELIHDAARRSAQKMVAKVEGLRARLRGQSPAAIALRSGAAFRQASADAACLSLTFMFADYTVTCPAFEVCKASGEAASPFIQAIVLSYLEAADGTPRAGEWVSLRELPGGQFYHQAFQGYTGNVLAAQIGDDLTAFRRGAEPIAEVRLPAFGDAAYAFRVLPNLHMAVIYWLGDDEFAPRASVLFDRAASHYLSIDGLAVVGSQLTARILRGAQTPV